MNSIIRESTITGLTVKRNIFITMGLILLLTNLLFGIIFFKKTERIVVVPAVLKKELG
jgi:hypothetical protein